MTGARRTITLSTLVGLLVVFLGVLAGVSALRDNSFFTHLATGRLILDEGIPRQDPYSFSAPGTTWVVQSWLASVLYASLEALGGLGAVRVAVGLATGVLAGLVWLLTAPARGVLVRVGLAGAVVVMGVTGFWSERPLMVGLLGLALVLLGAEGRFDPRWCIPIMWVWANSHGSFPLGVGALILLWIGTRLDGGDGLTERRMVLWSVVGTLAAAIGPLGPRLLVFPLELLQRQDVLAGVKEWKSPDFSTSGSRLFLLFMLVAIASLVRRPRWRAALPLLVFLALALLAARNQVNAALVAVPGTAAALAGIGQLTGERRSRVISAAALVMAAVTGLVLVSPLLVDDGSPTLDEELVGGPHLGLSGYPVAAISWLDSQDLLGGDGSRVIARDYVGNYLESLYGTDAHVFVDDRFDMYPEQVLEDQAILLNGNPADGEGLLQILDRYEPGAVLWETASPAGQVLVASPRWGVVYQDEDWMVACPRPQPGGPVACAGG